MSQELYYTAPPQACFDDMKKCCIAIWNTYDDTYGYASEKIKAIKDIQNVQDNFMYMAAMFDSNNIEKLRASLSPDALAEFNKRMPTGY